MGAATHDLETRVHRNPRRPAALRIGIGLAAAALATAAWLPGAAAASTGWQIAFQAHTGASTIYNGLTSVSASGKASAWAVGGTDLSGGTAGAPLAEHWTGTRWQAVALPGGLTGTLGAVSTPAPNDAWAVSQRTGYAVHWNGTSWSVAKTWPEHSLATEITGVTAFSPTNVWVFGAPGAYPGIGTWHLSGTTWHRVTGLAGAISTASAISRANMWAIGADSTAPDDILLRYNGTTWQQVTSTALHGLQFGDILALSDTNVWVTATKPGSGLTQQLLHFDGTNWTSVPVPSSVQLRQIAPDGSGGLWFSAARNSSPAPLAEHRSAAGIWSGQTLPTGTGQAFGMALIPGTASLWASGFVQSSGGMGSDAVIWGHGRAA